MKIKSIVFCLIGIVLLNGVVFAQSTPEILSKRDVVQMFSFSLREWNENVNMLTRTGSFKARKMASGKALGMDSITPGGYYLLTRPFYDNGDKKPSLIQVTVAYQYPDSLAFTKNQRIIDVFQTTMNQLNPEYSMVGSANRTERIVTFFFHISERGINKRMDDLNNMGQACDVKTCVR